MVNTQTAQLPASLSLTEQRQLAQSIRQEMGLPPNEDDEVLKVLFCPVLSLCLCPALRLSDRDFLLDGQHFTDVYTTVALSSSFLVMSISGLPTSHLPTLGL